MVAIGGVLLLLPSWARAANIISCSLPEEKLKLAKLINDFRRENDRGGLPLIATLENTAALHAVDLNIYCFAKIDENNSLYCSGTQHYPPPPAGQKCNAHSWSIHDIGWTPVCYTANPTEEMKQGMWQKPHELNDYYDGNGYENVHWEGGLVTAEGAFTGWRDSEAHREAMLWNFVTGMGIGMEGQYASLWLGDGTNEVDFECREVNPNQGASYRYTTTNYGAIAYTFQNNRTGVGLDADRIKAGENAVEQCNQSAGTTDCTLMIRGKNTCMALWTTYAAFGSQRVDVQSSKDFQGADEAVRKYALEDCAPYSVDHDCDIVATLCVAAQ